MSKDTGVALATEMEAAGRENPALLGRLVREYLRLREKTNELTRERAKVSEQLMPLLEAAGGSFPVRKNLRIYIAESERYEYDPAALHRLVDDGRLEETEFARALKTIVVKAVVEDWLKRGLVTEHQLAQTGAHSVTQVVRQLKVEALKKPKGN